ncbi:MAG: CopD family protein [Proteobacteria bacterium]|nr:CopD family protein [Pseudomonadota bacterium]
MALAVTLHLLAAVIWVGGMFFAYMALRPVAGSLLEPPVRQTLWAGVFKRFFPWVWLSIVVLLGTGFWMIFAELGGMANVGLHVHIMLLLGILMMLLFMHIYFGPFRRLKQAVEENNWETGGAKLNQIRLLIKINLILGLLVVIVATIGRY